MKDYHEQVLEDYVKADFTKRLHIFLDYPHLRSEFLLIDQNEDTSAKNKNGKRYGRSFITRLSMAVCPWN